MANARCAVLSFFCVRFISKLTYTPVDCKIQLRQNYSPNVACIE
jgi:hypothetical protein